MRNKFLNTQQTIAVQQEQQYTIEPQNIIEADYFLQNCHFASKIKCDNIREKIYEYFSKIFSITLEDAKNHLQQFCSGQEKQIVSKTDYQLINGISNVLFGINIMFILSLISILIDDNVQRVELTIQDNAIRLFYSITLIWLMFKFMIYICTKQKINYQFILEIPAANINKIIDIIDIILCIYNLVVTVFTMFSIASTFQESIHWPLPFGDAIQIIDDLSSSMQWLSYIMIAIIISLIIQSILSFIGLNKIFIHIQTVLYKVFTPWKHQVGFPLFYTADCLTSCGILLKDIFQIIIPSTPDYILMIVEMIPQLIRFIQCLKKYHDEKLAYPHLLNAGKYLSGVFATINNLQAVKTQTTLLIIFTIIKGIEQAYKLYYDIWQDFALLSGGTGAEQFKNQRSKWKYGFLCRRPSMLNKNFLLFAISLDIITRLTFLINPLYPQGQNNWYLQTFCICYLEIIRRFIWSILRIDNQMATNCENYLTCKIVPILQNTQSDVSSNYKNDRYSITQIRDSLQQSKFQNNKEEQVYDDAAA